MHPKITITFPNLTTVTVHDKGHIDVGDRTEVEISVEVPGKFSGITKGADSVCQSAATNLVCKETLLLKWTNERQRIIVNIVLSHVALKDSAHILTFVGRESHIYTQPGRTNVIIFQPVEPNVLAQNYDILQSTRIRLY